MRRGLTGIGSGPVRSKVGGLSSGVAAFGESEFWISEFGGEGSSKWVVRVPNLSGG